MKRSEINNIMKSAVSFFNDCKFYLPEFAFWTLNEWREKGEEIHEILENKLGWDITDYGRGDFQNFGLIHFTIRNGNIKKIAGGGKPYCEKIMIIEEEQIIPMHHHYQKIEDIINRGGGLLMIQLYNTTKDDTLADSPITFFQDGIENNLKAGSIVELNPGDSITIKPEHFHKFWAKKGTGKVLIGEVSTVNDDYRDNVFIEDISRFSEIEEDEEPYYLLYDDYENFLDFEEIE
ncbi:MAG: D-lyxose/D-mannose family sugar isomerase [Candidatus Lokiarchaeota archaeon]|nr:D-lyxose/D-mannose family sugar isomerase [Candidatus Lokiarchaeota archaeon]MBD3200161.1 D-lyxose/D-mannose family sugar isomerase [Candidatus Lokiarchaeota archaeon]